MKSWYLLGSISTENPFFQVPIVWVVSVGTREDPHRWLSVMYLSFFAIVSPLGTSIIEGFPWEPTSMTLVGNQGSAFLKWVHCECSSSQRRIQVLIFAKVSLDAVDDDCTLESETDFTISRVRNHPKSR